MKDSSANVQPVAVITGAGRGIGAACAEELAKRGYALALMSPSESSIVLAKRLGGMGFRGSVTELSDLTRLVDETLARHGRIDAVVVSTGHPPWSIEASAAFNPNAGTHLLDIPDDDWIAGVRLILLNAIRLCRLVTPVMVRQGGGSIVLISSFTAFEPRLAFPVSSVLRSTIAGFAKLYADRYAQDGIRINSVLPGFLENWPPGQSIMDTIPARRLGRMQEVAKAVAFLLSDDSSYTTGQSLLIDGGVTRSI